MQVTLKMVAEVYNKPEREDGLGQYKIKLLVLPMRWYLPLRFMLFNPRTGQYELYPNSTMDKYQNRWVDNFEFSKQTDFYELLLEEVIQAVEEETGITITRRGTETYEYP